MRKDKVRVLLQREEWFKVQVMKEGKGYNIVLCIDGKYSNLQDAKQLAQYWCEQLGLDEP